jgi:hypothetical protein
LFAPSSHSSPPSTIPSPQFGGGPPVSLDSETGVVVSVAVESVLVGGDSESEFELEPSTELSVSVPSAEPSVGPSVAEATLSDAEMLVPVPVAVSVSPPPPPQAVGASAITTAWKTMWPLIPIPRINIAAVYT